MVLSATFGGKMESTYSGCNLSENKFSWINSVVPAEWTCVGLASQLNTVRYSSQYGVMVAVGDNLHQLIWSSPLHCPAVLDKCRWKYDSFHIAYILDITTKPSPLYSSNRPILTNIQSTDVFITQVTIVVHGIYSPTGQQYMVQVQNQ